MKLITISGLDGSGKSTQIELLKTYLENQGKKIFYFHAIQFGLAQKIARFKNKYCLICRLTGKCKTSVGEKSVTKANVFQIALRKLFILIDIWRFKKLHTELRNSGYDYVLSDRYFYDSVVNVAYLEQKSPLTPLFQGGKIITPDAGIYLQTDPEIIMQRDRQPDQGIEYLQKKKGLYDQAAGAWGLKIIDGNRSKEEIFENIKKLTS